MYFSVGVQPAPVYVQPAPVYVQPRPVYMEPRPVYVQPEPIYEAAPTYHGGSGGYGHERRWARRYGPYGDLDRDGDGIRNRHDGFPMDPYRY